MSIMTELVWALPGVNKAEALARRKSRSPSYRGCWTCRERRVKCDERAVSCSTCERTGRACAGYGIRLVWPSVHRGNSSTPSRRRQLQYGSTDRWRMKDPEVIEAIANADKRGPEVSSTNANLFSIFPSSISRSPSPEPAELPQASGESGIGLAAPPDREPEEASPDPSSHRETRPSEHVTDSPVPNDATAALVDEVVHSPLGLARTCSDVSEANQPSSPISCASGSVFESDVANDGIPNDLWAMSSGYDAFCGALAPPALITDGSTELASSSLSDPSNGLIKSHRLSEASHLWHENSLSLDRALPFSFSGQTPATVLLHHYMENMVYMMQPVSHRSNPFKTIYLTTALAGSRDLASPQISPATVSVYHSVLASAAINLQGSAPEKASCFHGLAYYHRREALKAARSALDGRYCSYKAVMTAILSLVSVDIIDGGINDHWIHLEAARTLQESRSRFRLLSRQTRQLNTICKMLRLFAQTSQACPGPKPWSGEFTRFDNLNLDDLEASCVEFIYGITPFIATAISQIFQLSQYLAYYAEDEYPETLIEACEDLGDGLLAWRIESEPFSTIDASDEQMFGVARAQATAFYNAALIYYYRSVQKCEREELHEEQRATIEAMNLAEDLKSHAPEHHHWAAPITWPAFIASCEAVGGDRQHWAPWWDRVQSYQMANYVKQKAIVLSVWEWADSQDGPADWREILADMNVRIIPV